ncbi:MAG: GPR endopeptidase, partial [Bacilli bacterium]|nr:GPR endopeptidase [Bacilli bacterium]
KKDHIFIVGLGNENHTADSIGPKTLKHIQVNSFLENIGVEISGNKVSALEPGVLGETGILTDKIISSVSKEIKPDLIILIDSFVSDDINYLNKTIEITNYGINPGSGLKGINSKIDKTTLGIPILVIGVVTAIEIKFTNDNNINFIPYLLSTKDIDEFVINISKIIGQSINEAISDL